ncbi:MAG TPA: MFS transporter [Caulobacteraceae bacterium]|nr:MFS transporter [Caulobacteraceae bacterium]
MGQSGGGRFGWSVVGLLALAVFINYVDRGNVATAAPLIKDALHLSASQVGVLIAAFFWTYTPCQLLAGWLIERIDAYRTLALGLGIWSLATALTGLAGGFTALIALRLALGLGESAAFPASSTLLARHLPQDRLGVANGMIGLGLSLGPAFGTFAGGLLMARVGWRNVFLVFGIVSLFWLVPWLLRTRHLSRASAASPPGRGPSYLSLLKRRDAWGAYVGHFSANYATYFVLSWMPLYLVKARGYSVSAMAEIGGLIYLAYAASNTFAGWMTDARIRGGASPNSVRKTAAAACHITIAVGLVVGALPDPRVSVAGLFVAAIGMGFNSAGIFAIGQTLAGPWAAPKWIGAQNLAGNVAGMVGPVITGWLVDRTGDFTWAFVLSAVIALAGAVGWAGLIRKVEPLDWSVERAIRAQALPQGAGGGA